MKKIIFKRIRKVEILFLDENYSKIKITKYTNDQINFNEINLFFLPRFLINLFKNFLFLNIEEIYLKSIIEAYSPKIVIDHSINGRALKVKKLLKHIYCIVYQHSFFYENEKKTYINKFKNQSCDLYITYSSRDNEFLSKIINSKFISLGSLKNNEIIFKPRKKSIPLLLVSEFRLQKNIKETLQFRKFKEITKIIKLFCEKKNIVPYVALASTREDKKKYNMLKQEIIFFKKNLGKFKWKKKSSYELANISNLTINLSSNLGVELLSRGFKTVLVNLIGKIDKKQENPYYDVNKSFFFLNPPQQKIIKNLDKIYNMSFIEWRKKIKSFRHIEFDNNNKKFKNLIKEIISSKKTK